MLIFAASALRCRPGSCGNGGGGSVFEGVRVRSGFKGQEQRALGKCVHLLLERQTRDKSGVAPLVLGNNNFTGCEISTSGLMRPAARVQLVGGSAAFAPDVSVQY